MDDLKKKEQDILTFIMEEMKKKSYPPTVREIAEGVNLKSTASVYLYLKSLHEKGYIKKNQRKPRAIEIMKICNSLGLVDQDDREMLEIPIVGQITAGEPVLAVENIEDYFSIPIDFIRVKRENLFILKVSGDSMIEAGILHGDLAILKQQNTAQNGEIVAALIGDEEATIKTFYKENNHFRLQPENKTLEPILVSKVKILGVLVGIFRSYN